VGSAPYPGAVALVPVAGGALIIAGGTPVPEWGPERVLRLSPVRLIGRWSYGMYLWQIPVLLLVQYWTTVADVPLAGRFGFVAVTMVVAGLSYRFLESPIRRAPSLVRSPGRTLVVAAMTTAVGLTVVSLLGA
jgi:peptidoglycan/LPS O-acetylase OafA/YrhL